MTNIEALKAVLEGKTVSNKNWGDNCTLKMSEGGNLINEKNMFESFDNFDGNNGDEFNWTIVE